MSNAIMMCKIYKCFQCDYYCFRSATTTILDYFQFIAKQIRLTENFSDSADKHRELIYIFFFGLLILKIRTSNKTSTSFDLF